MKNVVVAVLVALLCAGFFLFGYFAGRGPKVVADVNQNQGIVKAVNIIMPDTTADDAADIAANLDRVPDPVGAEILEKNKANGQK